MNKYHPKSVLTTEEKWKDVDKIVKKVKNRKKRGQTPHNNFLEAYVDHHFNK